MKSFNRIFVDALFLAVALPLSASAQTNWTSIFSNVSNAKVKVLPRRASIVFIQVDGLGSGDLSCYGQTKFQTPNLDKLAAEGIRFTNYSVQPDELSSHFELVTGKNPWRGPSEDLNVAQLLKNSGYHTGLIGVWDLGDENSAAAPWRKGFDEFAGYLDSAAALIFYADYIYRYAPRAILNETNKQMDDFVGREMIYPNTGGKKGEYMPDVLGKAAANFVKNNQPDRFNHYKPFFLLVNFIIPSEKIVVPSDAPFSEESWPQPEKNRAALISRIDGNIGQLREQLDNLRLTNNVVIFFAGATPPKKTSEIDPAFFHSNISTNGLDAPLIVCWPKKIPAGQITGLQASPKDFLPTAAGIALLDSPANVDGVSLLPELVGNKSPAP